MKAVVHDRYGASGQVLSVRDIAMPAVADNDVLVRGDSHDAPRIGQVTPIVARTFPLNEVPAAMRCLEEEVRQERLSSRHERRSQAARLAHPLVACPATILGPSISVAVAQPRHDPCDR